MFQPERLSDVLVNETVENAGVQEEVKTSSFHTNVCLCDLWLRKHRVDFNMHGKHIFGKRQRNHISNTVF